MRKVYKFDDYSKREITINSMFETNGVETDYSKEQNEIIENLKLEFDYLKNSIPIEPFYLFSEALISNLNMSGINDDKDSIVYVTLCALDIIF